MSVPSVNIIILNWNGKEYIADLLNSIEKNTIYSNYNLKVVDNNSDDGSLEVLREYEGIELIENERNLGYSIGNNIGIYESEDHDYHLLLNNDMEVKEGWLKGLVKTAEENDAGVTGAKLFYPDGKIQHAGAEIRFGAKNHIGVGEEDSFSEDKEVEYVTGAAMLIRNDVINDIGYLDEILSPATNEDTDYCIRARKADYSVYFSSDSELIHYEGRSREKQVSSFIYFITRKNAIKFAVMNVSGVDWLNFLKRESKFAIGALIGYKNNSLSALIKAYREVLIDLAKLLNRRYSREEFIPSYYCEDIRDYSKRY